MRIWEQRIGLTIKSLISQIYHLGQKSHLSNGVLYSELKAHGDHYEISRNYLLDQTNSNTLWPSQAFQLLKTASSELGNKFTDAQIKSVMWNFSGSLIKK